MHCWFLCQNPAKKLNFVFGVGNVKKLEWARKKTIFIKQVEYYGSKFLSIKLIVTCKSGRLLALSQNLLMSLDYTS